MLRSRKKASGDMSDGVGVERSHLSHPNSPSQSGREAEQRSEGVVAERVVISTEQGGLDDDEKDSGISDAAEEQLLPEEADKERKENLLSICLQVFLPFMIAGFGMMLAGLLLDAVQHWSVYTDITEIFILVPSLLGLKGNLEMTLASRLSTAANTGALNGRKAKWYATWGNLSLIQAQALVVAALATLIAIAVGTDLKPSHMLVLAASSMGSACVASVLLGCLMILVVFTSSLLKVNPDNVATPIAASMGDLVTLALLSVIAQGLYLTKGTIAVSSGVSVFLLTLVPVFVFLAFRNTTTRSVLYYGWIPVITAMCISSGGGFVLSKAVGEWPGIAIYSPIINGVGGNLVAVQASRISTSLHQECRPGKEHPTQKYNGPLCTFCFSNSHSRTALLLVGMVVPGSVLFLITIHALKAGHTTLSPMFFAGYLSVAVLQVALLLLIADWLVHKIWRMGWDPDNIAIPFLTALGDLLGTGLLSLAFLVLWYLGDRDADVGE